jgi:pimeloyl-ACP methyl ester carboxylesterase
MKISFHRICTKDNLELCGLLYESDRKTKIVLLHIHGMGGNFYENKFLDNLAKILTDNNIAFCVFNNRGAEFIKDIFKKSKKRELFVRIGNSREKFEDCVIDISAYIDFLIKQGFKIIHLAGHSLGCSKAAYYLGKTKDKRIKSLILVSPSDMIGLVKADKEFAYRYKDDIATAKRMIKQGKGDEFMPRMVWDDYPITANSYLDIFGDNSKAAVFNFYNPKDKFKIISQIKCPIFTITGTKDDILFMPLNKMMKILKEKTTSTKRLEIKTVKNATHSWRGNEQELANRILNWLKK